MRDLTVLLACPSCGWLYKPAEYAIAYSPEKFVPHHSPPGKPGSWCFGTEQRPVPGNQQPLPQPAS